MNFKKTIIATVLALALVAVAAPVVKADQLSDLMAQITALTAQLNALQGTSTTATTGTGVSTGYCVGVTFTRNLNVGSTGTDVSCLQQIVGNPVTGTFGPNTLIHVKTWQGAHGIAMVGNVGPITRAALTVAMGTTTTTSTTTTTTTGTTALCPNGNTVASSCSLAPSAQAAALCPNGNTIASNCSLAPSAQASTATSLTGFIDAGTLAAAPASNSNVTDTTNVPVLGINVKAINSNMTVNSLKVQLTDVKSPSTPEHPATAVQNLYVYDGSTLLGTFPVNTNTVYKTSGGLYYVILSGFNFQVPANTTKVLTVSADFAPALETSRILTFNLFDTTSVGATDGTGATRTSGVNTPRVYTVTYSTVGTSTLTGTASASTPVSASVKVDTTSGTTGVPMLVFNAKSTVGASKLTDVVLTLTANDSGMADKVTAVSLYDSTGVSLGSVSPTGTGTTRTATFTDLAVDIAKDATKALTVKVDIADSVTDGDTLYITVTPSPSGFIFTTPNLSTGTPVGTIITGKTMYMYDGKAAVLSLSSPLTATYTYNATTPSISTAEGIITFGVKGDGGVLTKLDSSTVVVQSCTSLDVCTTVSSGDVSVTASPSDATTADGTTATYTVKASLTRGATALGYRYFRIYSVAWNVGGTTATQTWGLEDYRTPSVNVY